MADFDLAIIGGGINGTGIARDAAGRGLRVLLVEQNDLASGTSSASTKLIHGGLRYLEHGAFRLVREALNEREVLLRMAPHVIRPMRFMLPPLPGLRSPLRAAPRAVPLRLAGRAQAAAGDAHRRSHPSSVSASRSSATFRYGFEYSDCWVDDSRLVVLNALDAAERGAVIRTRTRCTRAERRDEWELVLNARGRRERGDRARAGQRRRSLGRRGGRHRAAAAAGRRRCGWSRAAISWCAGCSSTIAAIILQAPTGASCSRCRSRRISRLIGTTDENFVGDLNSPAPDAATRSSICATS